MKDTKGIRLFVYGTLKTNQVNSDLLEDAGASFIGYDSITGPFRMLDYGPFPVVVQDDKARRTIKGEVYLLDSEESLATIDFYEGHPSYFRRRKLRTDNRDLNVWVYTAAVPEFAADDCNEIEGPWNAHEREEAYWEVTF